MTDIIKENKVNLLFEVTEAVTGINRKKIVGKKETQN